MRSLVGSWTLVLLVMITVACGDDEGDKNTNDAVPLIGPWSITTETTSTLTGPELPGVLNGEQAVARLVTGTLLLPQPLTSSLSRLVTGISTCVATQVGKIPVAVTADSLRVDYDLDLTALCDESKKADAIETVTDIRNRAFGTIILSCVGGDFAKYKDKTLAEVRGNSLCANAKLINYAFDMNYSARKVEVKTVGEVKTTTVTLDETRQAVLTPEGAACEQFYEKPNYTITPCRMVTLDKTFSGTPEAEALPPTDPTGPKIVGLELSLGALTYENNMTYFSSGTANFWTNGWTGKLTYTNGNAPPRWEATKDAETVKGTIGQATLDTTALRTAFRTPR